MGKVISVINTTPDGFVDSHYVTPDAEYFEFIHELLTETQSLAFGRNTFELFQQVWPARLDKDVNPGWQVKMAQALHEIPKQVYSSVLKSTTWNKSKIVREVDIDTILHFKKPDQKGAVIFGSFELVATLTEMELIDDYYFCIQPLIAGNGNARLFDKIKLNGLLPLKMRSVKTLQSGVVIVHYERVD